MSDWRGPGGGGGYIPWASPSLPRGSRSSGPRSRGPSNSIVDTILPRLPVIGASIFGILLVLWISGVVNRDGKSDAQKIDAALGRAGYAVVEVSEEDDLIVLDGSLDTATAHAEVLAVARSIVEVDRLRDDLVAPDAVPEVPAAAATPTAGAPTAADLTLQAGLSSLLAREPIQFESASATILDSSSGTLDQLAALLTQSPDVSVQIAGHTDSDGEEDANLALSQARAEAVRDALVGRGVATERMAPQGYGEVAPIADNQTREGKARNRRIEVLVTRPEG